MKNNDGSFLELEEAVLKSRALLFLLSDKLGRDIEDGWFAPKGGSLAAGIIALGHEAGDELNAAYAANHETNMRNRRGAPIAAEPIKKGSRV
jgi:hypothetical protein